MGELLQRILLLLLIFVLVSCAHVKSGYYVQIGPEQNYRSLANTYKVPEWKIRQVNENKDLAAGDWVFIPKNWGVLGQLLDEDETEQAFVRGEFAWPVPSSKKISSDYGSRWGRAHEGIDIPARHGSHIVAAKDGVVVYSGNQLGGYGNITVISHDGGVFTVYAHAQKNYTRKGQKVHRGQVIATVGTTGRSTGPHLHFEIRHNSKPLNPKQYLVFDR
ncbi:MAG: hypothetical protein Fur0010_15410 [Bdellovibrio sp.]